MPSTARTSPTVRRNTTPFVRWKGFTRSRTRTTTGGSPLAPVEAARGGGAEGVPGATLADRGTGAGERIEAGAQGPYPAGYSLPQLGVA